MVFVSNLNVSQVALETGEQVLIFLFFFQFYSLKIANAINNEKYINRIANFAYFEGQPF